MIRHPRADAVSASENDVNHPTNDPVASALTGVVALSTLAMIYRGVLTRA